MRLAMLIATVLLNLGPLQAQETVYQLPGIPKPLSAVNSPQQVKVSNGTLTLTAKGKTNLFNNPGGNYNQHDAAMLLFLPDSNFTFSARVQANLREVYDVAALVLYENNNLWAKLCFENSIDKEATVVSVVTRQFSDDCNSIQLNGDFVYLCLAKKGDEFSFHCSTDNQNWYLVRHFRMSFHPERLRLGFAAHCSRSESFTANFSDISYTPSTPPSMRKYR